MNAIESAQHSRLANARLRLMAFALLVTFMVPCAATEARVQQVLLLQSFDRGNLILDHFTANFRVDLAQDAARPINIVQITVGPTGSVAASDSAIVDFIRSSYANRPEPDLIVSVAAPAAVFARKYRQQLFPNAPLLFASVDQRRLGPNPLADNEAAVSVINDFPQLMDDILQVLPQTKHTLMVMGSGPIARMWHQEFAIQFERFRSRVEIIWSDDLTLAQLLKRSASLPEHSAIFYFSFTSDALGAAYADERVLAELHAKANAPIFAAHSVYLGRGILGSTRMSIDDLSHHTAEAAARILNGTSPREIRPPPELPGRPNFDWRELRRWGIPESALPSDSGVLFRDASLWEKYRVVVLGAIGVVAFQALLISWLLFERRARRRAESDSRNNLALAADVSRREMMAVLGSAFSHDVAQPVSSMMYNAEALRMMAASSQVTAETVQDILTDIQTDGARAAQIIDRYRKMLRSHQLTKKPLDLRAVIEESVALVSHEVRKRKIEVITEMSTQPCVVNGDHVLLQQVLVNLLMNAIDATSETPLGQRFLELRTNLVATRVEVSVRDTGRGLSPEVIESLFKPFFTTKSSGLGIGLTIVHTIVRAHGGTIAGHNNPDRGAIFTFSLPRSSGVPESQDQQSDANGSPG